MVKRADSVRRVFAGALVIGEPPPASPRGFHRTYADRAARSHEVFAAQEPKDDLRLAL